MDPSDDCSTPRSGGSSGSDGKGSHSANTSSRRRRRLVPSSPTGTQLMSEFDAAGDAEGSESSLSLPSSGPLDLESVLLQATPVATDNTIIMEGELLDDDNEPVTPSGTRRSASLVVNNGLGICARRSISFSVDNNGPSSRVSISDLDLVLVSSGSQGSSGGGSGGRRNASNDQFLQREGRRGMYAPRNNRHYEAGSWSRQQPAPGPWQGAGQPDIQIQPQQGPESTYYPFNLGLLPGFSIPVPPPTWAAVPGFAAGLSAQLGVPVQGPVYLFAYPPLEVATVVPARRSSGLFPPAGVTIRHPPTSSGDPPPLPEPPAGARVTITAPPASERASSSAPNQPEATPPAPTPEQLETRPSQSVPLRRVPTFRWPPAAEEDALITRWLYGPSGHSRLPVFRDICPGDEPSQPRPPPPPPPPRSP